MILLSNKLSFSVAKVRFRIRNSLLPSRFSEKQKSRIINNIYNQKYEKYIKICEMCFQIEKSCTVFENVQTIKNKYKIIIII